MRKFSGSLILLILLCFLCGCTQKTSQPTPKDALFCDNITDHVQSVEQLHVATQTTSHSNDSSAAIAYDTTYAMWFPVMDYAETLTGQDAEGFRAAIRKRFQNAAAMGINTVFLHVRAYQDAYYSSELFPMGSYADTAIAYDPLKIMTEEAHALSLSVQAWINPLRGPDDAGMEAMDNTYPVRQWYDNAQTNGTYLVKVDGRWWLNPAYPEVRQLIADGAEEILQNYDVDGIHIDDYFYPTTDAAFDQAAFTESGASDLAAFRLKQTNDMVQLLYQTVHAANPNAVFSISPQGTLQGNYSSQFADVKTWASQSGYCDMLIPQIYFGFENETAPFADTVSLWTQAVTCPEVSLVIGIGTHKYGKEDVWAGSGSTEWQEHSDIPARQVEFLLSLEHIGGIAIYDYSTTFAPDTAAEGMAQQVAAITEMLTKQTLN